VDHRETISVALCVVTIARIDVQCRFSLLSPPQEQFPSHGAGPLLFGCLFKSVSLFHEPLLKGGLLPGERAHSAASPLSHFTILITPLPCGVSVREPTQWSQRDGPIARTTGPESFVKRSGIVPRFCPAVRQQSDRSRSGGYTR
jgi:hypothetical protein